MVSVTPFTLWKTVCVPQKHPPANTAFSFLAWLAKETSILAAGMGGFVVALQETVTATKETNRTKRKKGANMDTIIICRWPVTPCAPVTAKLYAAGCGAMRSAGTREFRPLSCGFLELNSKIQQVCIDLIHARGDAVMSPQSCELLYHGHGNEVSCHVKAPALSGTLGDRSQYYYSGGRRSYGIVPADFRQSQSVEEQCKANFRLAAGLSGFLLIR